MSQTQELQSRPVIAAAVAIAAGVVTVFTPGVTAPARADLGCVEWGFPAANSLLASGGVRLNGEPAPTNDDWSLHWSLGDRSGTAVAIANGTLTGFRDNPPLTGKVIANILPGGAGKQPIHLTFDSEPPAVSLNLDGEVNNDGNVVNSSEIGGGKLTWRMAAPFICNKLGDAPGAQGPVQGPDVSGEPVLGGLIVHVTDHSGKTSKCHYDSEVIDRDFTLNANSTADLRLIPAVPLGRNWPVTVTCDNGAKTEATINF